MAGPAGAWNEPPESAASTPPFPGAAASLEPLAILEPESGPDPYLVCPNCGATMYERGCKLRCRCGYFLSCSDI